MLFFKFYTQFREEKKRRERERGEREFSIVVYE
jgi:hypothetical protein